MTIVCDSAFILSQIRALSIPQDVRILNVCGGHERTLSHAGIRSLLPENIQIIPGPGCPVCVCPEDDIALAILIAQQADTVLASFGDMFRVPANLPKSEFNSLADVKAAGYPLLSVASPQDVIHYAKQHPDQNIVFFVAGFETTFAPIAAMIHQGLPENIQFLLAGRKTWPIVETLLSSQQHSLSGIVAPGHVATVMGTKEWQFVVDDFQLPCAVAGFDSTSLLAAIYSVLTQILSKKPKLENCYPVSASFYGNQKAQELMEEIFSTEAVNWRGIGNISNSGFDLKSSFSSINARIQYSNLLMAPHKRSGLMPPGCDCHNVVLGKKLPTECRLYGTHCRPDDPKGPCMVSDEGACHIWWSSGKRSQVSTDNNEPSCTA